MTWYGFRRTVAAVSLVAVGRGAHAQGRGGAAPGVSDPKLDALVQELQPYIPNHGTLTMGRGDTLIYAAVLTGTRHIPLGNVEVAIFPDSSRAGFHCVGSRPCILYDQGPMAVAKGPQMLDQVTWGIGSIRRNTDREMVFQGDPGPFKRVSDALTSLMAERARGTAADAGTVPATSAAELGIRQVALGLMNLPANRWTTVFSSGPVTVGVDLQGARTENGYRVTWLKTSFVPAAQLPEGTVSTVFAEQRLDCIKKRSQVTRRVLVLPGSVIARGGEPGNKWATVASDSTLRSIIDRVCAAG